MRRSVWYPVINYCIWIMKLRLEKFQQLKLRAVRNIKHRIVVALTLIDNEQLLLLQSWVCQ